MDFFTDYMTDFEGNKDMAEIGSRGVKVDVFILKICIVLIFWFLFCSEYTTITSNEQKRKYKEDFTSNYEEYKRLHAEVEGVSLKFAELEAKLRNQPRNTREYEVKLIPMSFKKLDFCTERV